MSQRSLDDTQVAIFIAPEGTEEIEFTESKEAVEDAGASVDVLSSEGGEAQAVENDLEEAGSYAVDRTFDEVSADDYDALVIPGGTVGVDRLRMEDEAVEFVREHVGAGKPTGVICHGPWLLVEADEAEGRTLTSFPSLETDVENAGGEWVDEERVVDDNVVTSRKPDDLEAFREGIVELFAGGSPGDSSAAADRSAAAEGDR